MKLNQKGFSPIEGILIVIIIGIIGFVGYFVYNANQQEIEVSNSSIEKTEKNNTTNDEPKLPEIVKYDTGSVIIYKKSDVSQLNNASDSFKEFIASLVPETVPEEVYDDICTDTTKYDPSLYKYLFISVHKITKDTFAVGRSGEGCGSGRNVWLNDNGSWREIKELGGQDIPECRYVNQYKIPREIIDECFDGDDITSNKNKL